MFDERTWNMKGGKIKKLERKIYIIKGFEFLSRFSYV